jgi:phosphomannomutase
MANFYSKCRHCEHAGAFSPDLTQIDAAHDTNRIGSREDLFCRDGVRGVYLTTLGRPQAEALAVAFAAAVWDRAPRRGRTEDELTSSETLAVRVPTIVLSRDAATSSPDIACGVVRGLRRMSCHVIEIGAVSRPTLDFMVYHLRADGGVHVTGAGEGRAATGLDLVGSDGTPWSRPGELDRMCTELERFPARHARRGGELRSFDSDPPARAEFLRHAHGLRQQRIGLMLQCPLQRQWLESWRGECPLAIVPVPLSAWPDGESAESRTIRARLRTLMHECELDWLARIGPDGRQVHLLDERARPIDPGAWLIRLAEHELSLVDRRNIVVGAEVPSLVRGRLKAVGCELRTTAETHEAIVRELIGCAGIVAADGTGRVWFADHYPICDGLVTVARLARLAARSAQPASHWAT